MKTAFGPISADRAVAASRRSEDSQPVLLPRMGKSLLFEAVKGELRPSRADELFYTGTVGPKHPITKQRMFGTALRKALYLSSEYAERECGDVREFDDLRRRAWARLMAAVYAWPELFDGFRGFASQQNAYTKTSMAMWSVDKKYHKGIDNALYELLEAGMTMSQVSALTYNLLFNCVDAIKEADMGRYDQFTPAAGFYRERIKPRLLTLALDPESRARIDRNIMFIIYMGMKRENGKRVVGAIRGELRKGLESPEERHLRLLLDNRYVQQKLLEGVSLEQLKYNFPLRIETSEKRPENRFA